MPHVHPAIRAFFGLGGRIAPGATTRLAYKGFSSLGKPSQVRPHERAAHDSAEQADLMLGTTRIRTYAWQPQGHHDEGPRTILLIHGWRSRASRFFSLVHELTEAGYRVVSYEAPGQGESAGGSASIIDYARIAKMLQEKYGAFHAVIGHSLGAQAGWSAISNGLQSSSLVYIAGVGNTEFLRDEFMRIINLPPRLRERFSRVIAANLPTASGSIFENFDAFTSDPGVPILFIHDRNDDEVPVQVAERLHRAHSLQSELLITEGLGHNRILSDPAVIQRVVEFLERVPAVSAPADAP